MAESLSCVPMSMSSSVRDDRGREGEGEGEGRCEVEDEEVVMEKVLLGREDGSGGRVGCACVCV